MSDLRWSVGRAAEWRREQGRRTGCCYIPSTAVNQLEMWQEDTWDEATIKKELGWARKLGFSVLRVFLHDLVWKHDRDGLTSRFDTFLSFADAENMKVIPVFFDDCWNTEPVYGKQPEPRPGVHNSGWAASPGKAVLGNRSLWPELEAYVKGIVSRHATDDRILLWDLYNEPGNFFLPALSKRRPARTFSLAKVVLSRALLPNRSFELLRETFGWARSCRPRQPLSAGIWFPDRKLNEFLLGASDIVTFHNYGDAAALEKQIRSLKKYGRPLFCTEYLARPRGSFETCLPVFRREDVGCASWGLVSGKTQTRYSWKSHQGSAEPEVWFHDLLYPDGTPWKPEEAAFIRTFLTGENDGHDA